MTPDNISTKPVEFLLVEDDEDHANMVRLAFKCARPEDQIEHVLDGEAAIARLQSGKPLPDVILLDLNLPKISGHEVLESIKSDPRLRSIPVVVLTTSHAEADRARAYASHVNSYVVKPLGFQRFKALIADVGEYWAVKNQPPPAA